MSVTDSQDRFARLTAKVEYPEAWKPEPGDTIVGEAVRWETVTPREGERSCEVLTLKTADGERSVWCWHAVLASELVGKASSGDLVAIHFKGKRTRQDGNGEYASYRVAIERGTEPTPAGGNETDDGIPY